VVAEQARHDDHDLADVGRLDHAAHGADPDDGAGAVGGTLDDGQHEAREQHDDAVA